MKKNRIKFSVAIAAMVIFGAAFVIAAENRGGETLKVDGGSKGIVSFPHKTHQDQLKDCNICHSVFAQEMGVIKTLKETWGTAAHAQNSTITLGFYQKNFIGLSCLVVL